MSSNETDFTTNGTFSLSVSTAVSASLGVAQALTSPSQSGNASSTISVAPHSVSTLVTPTVGDHEGLPENVQTIFKAVHIVLTVLALIINCLSLCVVYGLVDRLTRPLQILTSLAFGDMLMPWAVMTMYFPESSCQEEIHTALTLTAYNACSFSLLLLAVCHNIATFRPFTYDKIVSPKRLWMSVNLIWIVSILTAHLHFLVTLMSHHPHSSYCQQVQDNTSIALIMSISIASSTIIVSVTIYGRILRHLRPMEALRRDSSEPPKSVRGVITGVILIIIHTLAWIPYLIAKFAQVHKYADPGEDVLQVLQACQAIVLVVCMCDPVVYGTRMSNVQMGYLRLYHRCRGYVAHTWSRVARHGDQEELPSTPLNPIESIC